MGRPITGIAHALAVLLAASFCLGACKGPPPLAVLQTVRGEVVRDHAAAQATWSPALPEHTFFFGDGIKTAADGEAILRLADASQLKVRPQAVLRFMQAAATERRFDLEMGEVELELGETPMRLRSTVGLAIIDPGTRLVIARDGDKARYEVVVGMATFQQPDQQDLELRVGQRIFVDLQTAQIERPPTAPAQPAPVAKETRPVLDQGIAAQVKGRRVRQRADEAAEWRPLMVGSHRLAPGVQLDVPVGASVSLARDRQSATVHGAGRFVVGVGDVLIKAHLGRISFDKPSQDTTVALPGGTIVIRALDEGTRGDVSVDAKKVAAVKVHEGLVIAQTRVGSDEVAAGESLQMAPDGALDLRGRAPEVSDLVVAAGESCVVHDPTPPTAIEFDFAAKCPQGGRLRLGGHRILLPKSRSKTNVITLLPPGAYRYAILCGSDSAAAAEGNVQVIRDEGTAQLPRTPPASLIDTDGRNYTILYQNLLPEVQVRWPQAPKAERYELAYATGIARKTVKLGRSKHVFRPGALAEGDYKLIFVAFSKSEEVARSPETSVKIRFDNAAPAAVVRAPANRHFKPGAAVDVAGIALPGWQVSSMGDQLSLDPHHRFSGQVLLAPHQRALAIRFEHRDRGVHYYLRRPGGKLQ